MKNAHEVEKRIFPDLDKDQITDHNIFFSLLRNLNTLFDGNNLSQINKKQRKKRNTKICAFRYF